jgi:CRISPR/Cas system CSM-associated protein Csm3 (group 7 of RAMP superfamily)
MSTTEAYLKGTELGATEAVVGGATAISQIHTGADAQTGNKQLLRKEKIRVLDGNTFEDVPFVSGNSIRGHLRRLLAEDLVQRLDYTITDERLYHLLRAGGVLEKDGKAEIDVGLRRTIRNTFPLIDLLGGSTGNQMFEGTVNIHHLALICEENNYRNETQSDISWREFVSEMHQTRMHDEPDDTGMDVDFGFDSDAEDNTESDDVDSHQMIYHFDVLIPGAQFEHSVKFESRTTDLARSCLLHGLRLWQEEGTIGAMSAAGLGRVDISYELDLSEADRYTEYVDEQGGEIIEALDTIADR